MSFLDGVKSADDIAREQRQAREREAMAAVDQDKLWDQVAAEFAQLRLGFRKTGEAPKTWTMKSGRWRTESVTGWALRNVRMYGELVVKPEGGFALVEYDPWRSHPVVTSISEVSAVDAAKQQFIEIRAHDGHIALTVDTKTESPPTPRWMSTMLAMIVNREDPNAG